MSEEKPLETEQPSESAEPAKINSEKPAPKKGSFFSTMMSLLLVAVLVAAGFAGYLGYLQLQTITSKIVSLEQQEQHNKSALDLVKIDLTKDLAQLQKSLSQQNTTFANNNTKVSEQLMATQRKFQSVAGRHQSDWYLAEADYLVRIASNRLLLERDPITALALLMSADERILMMDDPGLQGAREALARDMAKLRLVQREDTVGITIRISGLLPQIKTLPMLTFQLPEETIDSVGPVATKTSDNWFENFKKALSEISIKWFEVRDHGRAVTPLMPVETEALLRNRMDLLLQTAQFATLRQQPELYQHCLAQLKGSIPEYFDATSPVVIAFINEIDALKALSVKAELPKTLESRVVIARQVAKKLNQATGSGEQQ